MKLVRHFQIRLDLFAILPLVNVLFLAFLLFALSSRFTLQPGLQVRLPSSPFTLAPTLDPLLITLTAAPIPAIYLGEEKLSLSELRSQLETHRAQWTGRRVIIRADSETPYGQVSEITNIALQIGFSVSHAFAPVPLPLSPSTP